MIQRALHQYLLFLPILLLILFSFCEEPQDTTPPTVSIQSPLSGQTVGEIVTIQVSTNDNNGILKVDFFIDDMFVHSDSTADYEYEWNTTEYEDGDHVIKVISYDLSENHTEAQPVMVTIDNLSLSPSAINVLSVQYDLQSLTVTWERSDAVDFKEYRLLSSNSETDSRDTVQVITDISTVEYHTTTFDPTHENWYWIEVSDVHGLRAIGTGVSNHIDLPPTQPEFERIAYQEYDYHISWQENPDVDFESYQLYESTSEEMSGSSEIFSSTNNEFTEFIVNDVPDNQYLFYQLVITDVWGLTSASSVGTGSPYQKITFSSSDGEISLMDVNGRAIEQLTDNNGSNSRPVYSPDGSKIAFRSDRDGREIYLINSDGSNEIRLTTHYDENPRFSPDGSQIVFTSFRDLPTGNNEVYIMNADGSNQTNLSNHYAYDSTPFFTRDGLFIIFRANRGASSGPGEVYRMDLDGSNQVNLTNIEGNDLALDSNSLNRILFVAFGDGDGELYLMDVDGSNKQRLTNNDVLDSHARFSSDETKIVYTSDGDLWLMNSDGDNKVQLTNGITGVDDPKISPDGTKIVFGSSGEIFIVNLDGSDLMNLGGGKFPQFQPLP